MNAYRRIWVFLLLLLPPVSSAEELDFGFDITGIYDTNIYTTSEGDEEDDYIIRATPYVRIEENTGDFQWDLAYSPSYDYFIQTSGKRHWTHQANGSLSWRFRPDTRIELSDRFGRFESTTRFNEVVQAEGAEGVDVIDPTSTEFRSNWNTRNSFAASLIHDLSSTQVLILNLGHNLIDFSRREQPDRESFSAIGRYEQTVTRRNRLGGGFSYQRASLDSSTLQSSQSTDFYNAFASWRYIFDETMELSVAAGPTWVNADDQDDISIVREDQLAYPILIVNDGRRLVKVRSCPTLDDGTPYLGGGCEGLEPDLTDGQVDLLRGTLTDLPLIGTIPSGDGETLTYFANVSLSKRWQRWSGTLSYRRQQSDTSSLGSSTVADIVLGALTWQPTERWKADLNVSWTRQTQATEPVRTVTALRPEDLTFTAMGIPVATFLGAGQAFALRAIEVDQDFEVDTLWVTLGVSYRLTERVSLFSRAFYLKRNSDVGRDYDNYRFHIGVSYDFKPIHI